MQGNFLSLEIEGRKVLIAMDFFPLNVVIGPVKQNFWE